MRADLDLDKLELASPGRFASVQERLEALYQRYRHIVAGEKFSMCEIYRNMSDHIGSGSSSLACSFASDDRASLDVNLWEH